MFQPRSVGYLVVQQHHSRDELFVLDAYLQETVGDHDEQSIRREGVLALDVECQHLQLLDVLLDDLAR